MRTFVRIVEAGSLSAAARQLATTQATVSRRLQSLETMLGVRLLLRTTHTTRLTDDGERCYQHARRVIDSWLALEDEVGQTEDEPVGVLRVRAPHAFGQDQLLKPVTEFLQRYPQLSIEWMLNDRSATTLTVLFGWAWRSIRQPYPYCWRRCRARWWLLRHCWPASRR